MTGAILVAIIGAFAGIVSGSLGGSQADTMLPGLVLLKIIPDFKLALGTVLLAILPPTNIGAVYKYWKSGHVNIMYAIILTVAATLFSYFGAVVGETMSARTQKRLLASYLVGVAIFLLYSSETVRA